MPRTHRIIGWLTCLTVAVGSVGIPLPARAVKKTGEPFPCQHCPCGCTDAETCWRDCCCHTNEQKLAWAKRNGVTPPAFVLAVARRENMGEAPSQASRCCSKAPTRKAPGCRGKLCCGSHCGSTKAASTMQPLASRPRCCKPATKAADEDHHRAGAGNLVMLVAKLRCGGVSLSVSPLPPSVASPRVEVAMELLFLYDQGDGPRDFYEPPHLAVAVPPPEALLL